METGDIQFLRHAEVLFHNYETGLVTQIKSNVLNDKGEYMAQSFRIAFEYTKNDDQGYNTPNGKIVIYGLSEETFKKIGDRMKAEVEVKAGYLNSKTNNPQQLFFAVLMDKTFEMKESMSVSTFTVLGDFLEKSVGNKMSKNLPSPTLWEIMVSIGQAMGKYTNFAHDFPENLAGIMTEIISEKKLEHGYVFAYTPQEEMKRLKDSFGIKAIIEKEDVTFSIVDSWYNWYINMAQNIETTRKKQAESALVAENKTIDVVNEDEKPKIDKVNIKTNISLVLSPESGLIGSPKDTTKIANKDYDQGVSDGEEVWDKKNPKVIIDKKTGQARTDKETGEVKMSKTPKTYKVARRTVLAKCFINSLLDFNALVTLKTKTGICDGVYRVRSVKIKGDTCGQDWYMELELNE